MQARQQPARREIAWRIDNDTAGFAVGCKATIANLQLLKGFGHTALVVMARISEHDTAAMTNEKRLTNAFFKQAHLVADGRLGEA